jgi:3-oxoacid CoA-transferase B subunit
VPERLDADVMAMVVARDFQDGDVVNLGVGLPLACANYLPEERDVLLHSELGLLGFGPVVEDPEQADPYLTQVGNLPVTPRPGMAFMSHDESFALIRGGRIDVTVLGAFQVDARGNLANFQMPGKVAGNLGGAPDLAVRSRLTVVLMHHTTAEGQPKIVRECDLPLTAPGCVDRIVTDIAVMDVADGVLTLREYAPGWDDPEEIQRLTGAPLAIADDLREISLG